MEKDYLLALTPLLIIYVGYVCHLGYKNFSFVGNLRSEKIQIIVQAMLLLMLVGGAASIVLFLVMLREDFINSYLYCFGGFYLAALSFITIEWLPIIGKGKFNSFSRVKKLIYPNKSKLTIILIVASTSVITLDIYNLVLSEKLVKESWRILYYFLSLTFMAMAFGRFCFEILKFPWVTVDLINNKETITGYFLGYTDYGDIILSKDQYPETATEVMVISRDTISHILYEKSMKGLLK